MSSNAGKPLVSVVIPSYNRRRLLQRAVDSVRKQTDVLTEIIICDDGSTDGTADDWQKEPDVIYLSLPHTGACAARNAGIRQAGGLWTAFLDSDDCWQADKLSRQLALLQQTDADAVCCAFSRHETNGQVTVIPGEKVHEGFVTKEQLLHGNFISTQTIFGRTGFFRRVLFDTQLSRLQDWDFAIRMAEAGKLYYRPESLADVWLQSDSISMKPELGTASLHRIYEKNRTAYGASVEAAEAWQKHMYYFAVQSGESVWQNCSDAWKHTGLCLNKVRLIAHAVYLSARCMIKRCINRSKMNKHNKADENG